MFLTVKFTRIWKTEERRRAVTNRYIREERVTSVTLWYMVRTDMTFTPYQIL